MPTILKILQFIVLYLKLCQGEINMTEYKRMPDLYNFDNYRDCMYGDEAELKYPAKYCMVFIQIQPNNDSSVWQQIDKMMPDKFNYRHDNLFKGLCMERCKDLLENNGSDRGYEIEMLTNEQTQMFQKFYNTKLDRIMRYDYQREIHDCVNREYVENYNLSTKTFVNFCIDPNESREKDIYFRLTLLLIIMLVLINILSTIYDAKLKSKQLKPDDSSNYYEVKHSNTGIVSKHIQPRTHSSTADYLLMIPLHGLFFTSNLCNRNKKNTKVNRCLTAFSLYRNYKRLVMPNNSGIGSDLRFLDGFRSILCLLIIIEHGHMLVFFHLENTEYIENSWRELATRLFAHALIWLELFFVLSGLLMYVKFEKSQYITTESSFLDCVRVFVRLLFSRYLRYLPSLLFIIIFIANINNYYGNTSLARSIIDANCFECRDSWWRNIFMINNYYIKSMCLLHTWYISAEFHLYGLFLIILIIMAKYPKAKNFLLISVAVLAAAINFGLNYILKLDSAFILGPESFRYSYFHNIESAQHLYFSSYTNINSFLLGTVCGFIYMKYLRNNPENKKQLGKLLEKYSYIGWTAIFGILYLGTKIMAHKETTIWTAAYGLLHRHVGLAIVAVIVILRGMCNGGGFLRSSNFGLLARISFQMYLWQIPLYNNILSYFNQPISISHMLMYMFGVFIYIFTGLVAFVVALFIEYPIAEVISIIDIEKKIKKVKTS